MHWHPNWLAAVLFAVAFGGVFIAGLLGRKEHKQ